MEEMRKVAFASVARGCGFGMLAIVCVMVGMSFDPRAVFQAGGILTLMMMFILILKARYALTQNYKQHRDVALSATRISGRRKPTRNGRPRPCCATPISPTRCTPR